MHSRGGKAAANIIMSCESEQKGSISFNISANISGWFVEKKHLFISFQFLMIYLSHSCLGLPAKIHVFCVSVPEISGMRFYG